MTHSNVSTRFHKLMGALAAATLLCALGHSNPVVAADWKEEPAPTSVAGGWAMIDKDMAQLESLIKAGKIGDLGSSAYGIANAFKGVSQLSTSLPPDKLADVQASVKVVGSQASKIDKAGEHNDTAGVQTNLQALKATLAKVRAYYPQ